MKEIDDTDPTKSESEVTRELDIVPLERLTRQLVERIEDLHVDDHEEEIQELRARLWKAIAKIEALELRVANLETRRVANENNQDDPGWW